MKTTVVNLFGAPGVGKSTLAALLFGYLKRRGYKSELVTEFAKELVWDGRVDLVINNQVLLLAEQKRRVNYKINQI